MHSFSLFLVDVPKERRCTRSRVDGGWMNDGSVQKALSIGGQSDGNFSGSFILPLNDDCTSSGLLLEVWPYWNLHQTNPEILSRESLLWQPSAECRCKNIHYAGEMPISFSLILLEQKSQLEDVSSAIHFRSLMKSPPQRNCWAKAEAKGKKAFFPLEIKACAIRFRCPWERRAAGQKKSKWKELFHSAIQRNVP